MPIDSRDSDVVVGSTNRKNSVLTIESVAARHAGDYTCTASNRVGATTHTAHLAVNGTCKSIFTEEMNVHPHLYHASSSFSWSIVQAIDYRSWLLNTYEHMNTQLFLINIFNFNFLINIFSCYKYY